MSDTKLSPFPIQKPRDAKVSRGHLRGAQQPIPHLSRRDGRGQHRRPHGTCQVVEADYAVPLECQGEEGLALLLGLLGEHVDRQRPPRGDQRDGIVEKGLPGAARRRPRHSRGNGSRDRIADDGREDSGEERRHVISFVRPLEVDERLDQSLRRFPGVLPPRRIGNARERNRSGLIEEAGLLVVARGLEHRSVGAHRGALDETVQDGNAPRSSAGERADYGHGGKSVLPRTGPLVDSQPLGASGEGLAKGVVGEGMNERASTAASSVSASVNDLLGAVTGLLDSVRSAVVSSGPVVEAGARVAKPARLTAKAAGDTGKKIGAKVKAAWARYTPKERAARIRKMLAARGLKPKGKKVPTARGLALKKAIKASWAKMTPQQRAERIAKMQRGRGLKPKTEPDA